MIPIIDDSKILTTTYNKLLIVDYKDLTTPIAQVALPDQGSFRDVLVIGTNVVLVVEIKIPDPDPESEDFSTYGQVYIYDSSLKQLATFRENGHILVDGGKDGRSNLFGVYHSDEDINNVVNFYDVNSLQLVKSITLQTKWILDIKGYNEMQWSPKLKFLS